MSARVGTTELSTGGQPAKDRIDGVHPINGGGSCNGSESSTQSIGFRSSGITNTGNDGGVQETTWFDPVKETEDMNINISDCPGGICPVPWANKGLDTVMADTSGDEENKEKVNSPSHYNEGEIECIEAIEAQLTREEYRGYLKGTLAVYMWREKHKNGFEDILKAQWHMKRLVDLG